MRSNTAFVLATLAIGQAAAGHLKHKSFHARRSNLAQDKVEIDVGKREAVNYDVSDVDWTKALEHVDWSKVNYGGASSTPSPSVAAPSSSAVAISSVVSVAKVKAEATPTPTPTSAPAYTPSATPSSSSPAAAASSKASTPSLTGAILEAADKAKLLALGFIGEGLNEGAASVGSDGPYVADVSNTSGEDLIFVCWAGATSWVNAHVPALTVSIASGSSKSISFTDSFSGACSAVYEDTELVNGQVSNTWLEATFGAWGTYDVSREVNMSGHSISAVGPTCTSDMNTCVFKCNSGNSCMSAGSYSLHNCGSGAVGTASDGGASGGCQGLGSAATIKVTLS
ncbi:hypothetical protein BU16DRAFT_539928 [Lophium mytilinum]|uniref:Effector 5 n=1 Tax=Lophium mytilinum TaxID=390894 RepID=A0A6A6QR71_9PEZI|nr:hypothetical protein BU16DRAFT_539928 [Lophium mytilinum]